MTGKERIVTTNSGITVRDVCGILRGYKQLHLVIDGGCIEFYPENQLHMEAFGDFVVDGVLFHDGGSEYGDVEYELEIARASIKRV